MMSRRCKLSDEELRIVNAKITDEEAFNKFERNCSEIDHEKESSPKRNRLFFTKIER